MLDAYKYQIGRLPQVEQCLLADLDTVIRLQEDSSAMCFNVFLLLETRYTELCEEKTRLEEELRVALQFLKEMNEVERRSIEVNQIQSVSIQQQNIEQIRIQIDHIEQQIQKLKEKMQQDCNKLRTMYDSFILLKNEILGIEMEEEASFCVCWSTRLFRCCTLRFEVPSHLTTVRAFKRQ